jgi:hypothetical protein
MKTTLPGLLFCLISLGAIAQVPQGFNYQAVARDAAGTPITGATISVRLSILTDTTNFFATGGGTYLWEETHSNVKTNSFGLFTIVLGSPTAVKFQGTASSFSAINWTAVPLYIGTKIYQTSWKNLGTAKLWSVPYALVSAKADSAKALLKGSKLAVVSNDDASVSALFEVKRKDGQTVFAVYPDAVNIYVPPGAKGSTKGGFAIGGFGAKAGSQDYFRVTPDSVRIYINNAPPAVKGSTKGGFAIGGFDGSKGILPNYFMNVTGASAVNTVDSAAQILWYPNKQAFLAGKVSIVSADSVGTNSTALGYKSRAIGNFSQAFGYRATARGDYSTSIGKLSIAGARVAGVSTASNAFAFGNGAIAIGSDSYALGSGAIASGYRSFAFGSVGLDDAGNPTSTPTTANQPYTFAIGMGARATQKGAMALGIGSLASGYYSNSFGYYSTSSGYYSTALGFRSTASNYYAGALGYYANAAGEGSLALGYSSTATSNYATAVGSSAMAANLYASAFGRSATANGNSSVAVGYLATTSAAATDASAFGKSANASGVSSMALGVSAFAPGIASVAMGYNANSTGDYSFAIGTYGLDASGNPNTALPTKTFLSYSMAMGMGAQSTKKGAVSIGVNSTASGDYSNAMGYGPTASGNYSTAIGVNAASAGLYSGAIGYGASSSGNYSTSIGMNSVSSGSYSSALGYGSKAIGDKSLAVGSHYSYTYLRLVINKFTGTYSWQTVTASKFNTATRDYSIAIGNGNTAEDGGMALGANNSALSFGSVAIGHSNVADTSYSFAAGYGNTSSGFNSFALGENLIAQSSNSFVIGAYNNATGNKFTWVEGDPLFVVGNGESGATHDALRLNKNGGLYLYPENAYAGLTINNYNTSTSPNTYHYGIINYIQRNKASAYYYSSYSYSGGSQGNYYGEFADLRAGASIDVAEYINDSYGDTEPADVVVADSYAKESVMKSSKPYQTEVLGVISTRPHLTMGTELGFDEKTGAPKKGVSITKLALTGRVPVNVTGENGAIEPGDYLTSSSTPGFAMKWTLLDVNSAVDFADLKRILAENERRRGAIFGKAVESFSGSGTAKIMVLISLQ